MATKKKTQDVNQETVTQENNTDTSGKAFVKKGNTKRYIKCITDTDLYKDTKTVAGYAKKGEVIEIVTFTPYLVFLVNDLSVKLSERDISYKVITGEEDE